MSVPLALALGLVALAPDGGPALPDVIARGDAAFARRGDPPHLAEALDAYRRAAALDPGNPEAEVRLARAEAFRALQSPADAAEAWPLAGRAAERALRRLAPAWAAAVDAGAPASAASRVEVAAAEPLYWLALAAWSGAQAKGFAAVLAVKDVALASMEQVALLDARIDCGGPHRALGAWRAALPAAVGGGAERSRGHFEKALAIGPRCQWNRVREAETLFVLVQDRRAFEAALGEALAPGDPDPEWGPENDAARRAARDLLGRKDRLF